MSQVSSPNSTSPDSSSMTRLVMFDMAGTTVDDSFNGVPLVTYVLQQVFNRSKYGIDITPDEVTPLRGQKKIEMVRKLVELKWTEIQKVADAASSPSTSSPTIASVTDELFSTFETILSDSVNSITTEIAGTSDIFRWLHRDQHVAIGVGSGFSHEVVERLAKQLNWVKQANDDGTIDFDLSYIGGAEQAGKGRPDPTMMRHAMDRLKINDPRQVVKIGDTQVDIEEGKAIGCVTVGVLSGTQSRDELAQKQPDFIIESIKELPTIWNDIQKRAAQIDANHANSR